MDQPNIEDLYHPVQKYINSTSLELLLIEIVPLALRVAEDLSRQMDVDVDVDDDDEDEDKDGDKNMSKEDNEGGETQKYKPTTYELAQAHKRQIGLLESPHADEVYARIETYGYRVGRGLSEILTQERRGQFTDQLDIVKFICKDLWPTVFRKSIDNLKTNHRGTYVLVDNNFGPCKRMSTSSKDKDGQPNTLDRATPFLWFPVGLIRGCLEALGMGVQVTFEATELPSVSFHIQSQNK